LSVFEDYQRQWYINRGVADGEIDDMERAFYISVIALPTPEQYVTKDLEIFALQSALGSSAFCAEDMWFEFLDPMYGPGLSVRDLQYELYKAG